MILTVRTKRETYTATSRQHKILGKITERAWKGKTRQNTA